jgi:hypothetical protein
MFTKGIMVDPLKVEEIVHVFDVGASLHLNNAPERQHIRTLRGNKF